MDIPHENYLAAFPQPRTAGNVTLKPLTLAGAIRELLGSGKIFGAQILPEGFGMTIFIQPPGAFLVFALIIAVMNAIGIKTRQRQLVESGCDGNCALCSTACEERKAEAAADAKPASEQKGGDKA